MSKYLAVIPARSGSKGINNKNMLKIDGLSLIERAINSAQNSNNNLDIVLSSDSEEILNEADRFNVISHKRKPQHATDSATTASVIQDIIMSFDQEPENIIVLQPTSPYRTEIHVDKAIEIYGQNNDCDGLVSVFKESKDILKSFFVNEYGYIKGTYNDDAPFAPRQSLPKVYRANGAIFIVKTSIVKKEAKLYGSKMIPFLMDKRSSLDIDTLDDLRNINYELHV